VGHEIDTSLSDLAADAAAPTPTAATEVVARGWRELSRDLDRMPGTLLRLTEGRIAGLEARLEAIAAERTLRRPEDALGVLAQRVDSLFERMWREARHAEAARLSRLRGILPRLAASSPGGAVRRSEVELSDMMRRLRLADESGRERKASALRTAAGRLEAVSPLAVLARGYSLAYREKDSSLLRRAEQAGVGERVRLRLSEGMLICWVEESLREGEGT
jgi:exodeoxyribonuclease VII large subunit